MKAEEDMKKVMAFGVFDGLHAGHRAFLADAKKHGSELIAVVARDSAVRLLKKKMPRRLQAARVSELRKSGLAGRVVLGDKKQGTYLVVVRWKPDIICLGYDQDALAEDLKKKMPDIRLVWLKAHKEEDAQ